MTKRRLYILLSLVFFAILINSLVNKEYIVTILVITGLALLIIDIFFVTDIKLVITKSKLHSGLRTAHLEDHYVIFLEVSNLTTYSQFYDIRVGDHIIKKIYLALRKELGKRVYLYRTDQIVIIREFENKTVVNQTLRLEEQYRNARKIHRYLTNQSYAVDHNDSEYDVTIRMGCASVGLQKWEQTIDDLVKLAHFSMIKAEEQGVQIIAASEEIRIVKRDLDQFNFEIEEGLHLDEFSPYFLPIVNPDTLHIIGCESFVRWEKNKYRVIDAGKFKHIALEKNLFGKIDIRVIEKTFEAYQNWLQKGLINDAFKITVNISKYTLLHIRPLEFLNMAREYNIPPQNIEFDISENDIQEEKVIKAIKQLKAAHFTVSVDAFGSTSISLQSLLQIDIDTIKIDKFNLDEKQRNDKEYKFYKTIVRFAKVLQYEVMSKGIENKTHLHLAQDLNVDYVQGYYFTPPLNKNNILIYLKKYQNGILSE